MSEAATITSEAATARCENCGHVADHAAPVMGPLRSFGHRIEGCEVCLTLGLLCTRVERSYANRESRQTSKLRRLQVDVERVELEAAEWCERARVAEKRVAEFVGGVRRAWWPRVSEVATICQGPVESVTNVRINGRVTVFLSVEEYGRLTRELAEAKARITELQEANTREVGARRKAEAKAATLADRQKRADRLVQMFETWMAEREADRTGFAPASPLHDGLS